MKHDNDVGVRSLLDSYIEQKYPDKIIVVTHPEDTVDIYYNCLSIIVVDNQEELQTIVSKNDRGHRVLNEGNIPSNILNHLGNFRGGIDVYINGKKIDG